MVELSKCQLFQIKDGNNLLEEVTANRNTISSYIVNTVNIVYGYSGADPLSYPWDDGFAIRTDMGYKKHVLFDLNNEPYHSLVNRKIKAQRCLYECN